MRYRYDDDDGVPQTLEEFGESIKADLRQEYTEQRNIEQFWNHFYGANPELRADDHVVHAVYQEHIDELMASTPETALKLLATKSQERVEWLRRTADQRREAACYVGGPSLEGVPVGEQPMIMAPGSMSGTIRGRREARRIATMGGYRRGAPSNKPTYGRSA
jgi:hypothetical protein